MPGGPSENRDELPSRVTVSHKRDASGVAERSHKASKGERVFGIPPTWEAPSFTGPRLQVVHGPEAGRSFRLKGPPSDPARGWVVGRGQIADVRLDGDPHVERQAVDIAQSEDGFELVDLRTADLRASLNGDELGRGEHREIEDGDLIGIGASLVIFRD